MIICALSDIHGNLFYIDKAAEVLSLADVVVIAGDFWGKQVGAAEILERIERYNPRIIAVHGNWDGRTEQDTLLRKSYSVHATGMMAGNVGFFGAGGSPPTSMNTPAEYSNAEISAFLRAGYEQVQDAPVKILITHAPPKNTRDKTFFMKRAGSTAVRKFILEKQLDLNICGHIHEAYGVEKLNSTTIVNPGSFARGRYAVITLNEKIVVKLGAL